MHDIYIYINIIHISIVNNMFPFPKKPLVPLPAWHLRPQTLQLLRRRLRRAVAAGHGEVGQGRRFHHGVHLTQATQAIQATQARENHGKTTGNSRWDRFLLRCLNCFCKFAPVDLSWNVWIMIYTCRLHTYVRRQYLFDKKHVSACVFQVSHMHMAPDRVFTFWYILILWLYMFFAQCAI